LVVKVKSDADVGETWAGEDVGVRVMTLMHEADRLVRPGATFVLTVEKGVETKGEVLWVEDLDDERARVQMSRT
jgi:hypothetical protein